MQRGRASRTGIPLEESMECGSKGRVNSINAARGLGSHAPRALAVPGFEARGRWPSPPPSSPPSVSLARPATLAVEPRTPKWTRRAGRVLLPWPACLWLRVVLAANPRPIKLSSLTRVAVVSCGNLNPSGMLAAEPRRMRYTEYILHIFSRHLPAADGAGLETASGIF